MTSGLVFAVSFLSCFLILAVQDPFWSADHHLSCWFHGHLAEPFTSLMLAVTNSASEWWVAGMTLAIGLVLVFRRKWYGLLTLALTVPGGTLLGELLKDLVRRDRPYHESALIDLGGYSFPSGHTLAATLLYGLLAVFAILVFKSLRLRFLVGLTAALIVILVGLSRIALGAHYLTDVLGAMACGLVWLWLCFKVVRMLRRCRSVRRRSAYSLPVNSGCYGIPLRPIPGTAAHTIIIWRKLVSTPDGIFRPRKTKRSWKIGFATRVRKSRTRRTLCLIPPANDCGVFGSNYRPKANSSVSLALR